ncbi:MAG TPA: carboxypeptidase-like regulatory domain-containing protein [Bryobacteraceae bacterium]|nr:carboxypeptidase-like regulatory domain-containing protein [Bryobacteraceae bacterium]
MKKRSTRSNAIRRGAGLASIALLAGLSCWAGQKKAEPAPATVAGTVFRDPGFALPGAKVVLFRKEGSKTKKLAQTETNERGEFSFEAPPAPATYIVQASRKGFRPEQKEASVSSGGERIEVTISLAPESK